MIDLDYLAFLENILTDNRKEKFLKVLGNRTKHFTVVVEDVFQMHNTSAVMRICEVFGIQELNVIEQRYGKRGNLNQSFYFCLPQKYTIIKTERNFNSIFNNLNRQLKYYLVFYVKHPISKNRFAKFLL